MHAHSMFLLTILSLAAVLLTPASAQGELPVKLRPVPFTQVRITGGFWGPRQDMSTQDTPPPSPFGSSNVSFCAAPVQGFVYVFASSTVIVTCRVIASGWR